MIHVNRHTIAKPEVLTNKAKAEHDKAHKHYITDGETKAFDHKLFKNLEVKTAIETLFNGKCAYCESRVDKTSPVDKEHFRPKTSVKNKDTGDVIRGYYWLAADWDNLLLACAHCNRTGTHKDVEGEEFVSGKLDYFPLADESKRATAKGSNLKAEEKVRLIINPCEDKPENSIAYNEDGEIFPKLEITKHQEHKVKTSVEIFGLQRSQLHKDRKEKWQLIQSQIIRIKENYEDYLETSQPKYLERLKREFKELKRYKNKEQEHLGVARFVIRQEMEALKAILIKLKTYDS